MHCMHAVPRMLRLGFFILSTFFIVVFGEAVDYGCPDNTWDYKYWPGSYPAQFPISLIHVATTPPDDPRHTYHPSANESSSDPLLNPTAKCYKEYERTSGFPPCDLPKMCQPLHPTALPVLINSAAEVLYIQTIVTRVDVIGVSLNPCNSDYNSSLFTLIDGRPVPVPIDLLDNVFNPESVVIVHPKDTGPIIPGTNKRPALNDFNAENPGDPTLPWGVVCEIGLYACRTGYYPLSDGKKVESDTLCAKLIVDDGSEDPCEKDQTTPLKYQKLSTDQEREVQLKIQDNPGTTFCFAFPYPPHTLVPNSLYHA